MPVVVLFLIFVALLVFAVPVSITLGITSVLPSVFDPSFTVGAKYLIRAMFGGLDSFPLLAVPMFVLSGIIMVLLVGFGSYFFGNTIGNWMLVYGGQDFSLWGIVEGFIARLL